MTKCVLLKQPVTLIYEKHVWNTMNHKSISLDLKDNSKNKPADI